MRVFRIGLARYLRVRKEAFSGKGGMVSSGRWHTEGHPVIYTAQSLSLAALEILVHLKQTQDVEPFMSYAAEIPDDLILKPQSYPARWKTRIEVSRAFGDEWLEAKTPALRVPTVLAPGEWNVLLNPLHADFSLSWIQAGPERFAFDARLLVRKKKSSARAGERGTVIS
jgi:RES domain-containing protein